MSEVVIVQVNSYGNDMACYLEGHQIASVDPSDGEDLSVVENLADRLAEAVGVEVKRFVRYPEHAGWTWEEVAHALIVEGVMVPPKGANLMRGFYRCTHCYTKWDQVDGTNSALTCINCRMTEIEPYSSANPDTPADDPMVLTALANHEKEYPSPLERGDYEVELSRTTTRSATIRVDDAAGPATAHLKALREGPDVSFSPNETDAQFDVQGCLSLNPLRKGGDAYWSDPDAGLCSCEVEIVSVAGEDVTVTRGGGDLFSVPYFELTTIEKE